MSQVSSKAFRRAACSQGNLGCAPYHFDELCFSQDDGLILLRLADGEVILGLVLPFLASYNLGPAHSALAAKESLSIWGNHPWSWNKVNDGGKLFEPTVAV